MARASTFPAVLRVAAAAAAACACAGIVFVPFVSRAWEFALLALVLLFVLLFRGSDRELLAALPLQSLPREDAAPEREYDLQEFTEAVIENAPMSMIAADASGIVIAMNAAAEQLTLYSRDELVGKQSVTLLHDPLELRARAEELAQVEAGERTSFETLTFRSCGNAGREWTYLRKDGQRAYVTLAVTSLMTPGKRIAGYLCTGVDVTERKRLTDSVTHLARYDQLTGLANRAQLNQRLAEELEQARRSNRQLAVCMIDVDSFKRVNDSLGHGAGDQVLCYVARQLSDLLSETTGAATSDTAGEALQTRGLVARVDGDAFAVLLAGDREAAELRAQQMLTRINAPVTIAGREVRMTASLGLSLYPQDGNTGDLLLGDADLALGQAKADGRNCMRVFSPEMRREAADRLELEEDLRHALAAGEFELHYQPQVSCMTGHVTGMETLLRWNSPKRGNVAPNFFLPIAEQAGLLVEIGEWGLRQACLDCRQVQQELGRPLQVAVNLSPRQVTQHNLVAVVKQSLAESGLAAADLELEITEEILMASTQRVKNNLKELRELGCSVAIDDFGTGFSSFAYILEYKVDRLKIDRSFVSQLNTDGNANAIVRAIIAMGRGLDIDLVAEGVETQEQLGFLLRKHCTSIQGWLFSKALPISRVAGATREIEKHAQEWMGLQPTSLAVTWAESPSGLTH